MTGKHLSQGDVKSVIADRLEAASYASHLTSLPAVWQVLLGRMIEIDPSLRPRDGNEVLQLLKATFPNHPGHPVVWDCIHGLSRSHYEHPRAQPVAGPPGARVDRALDRNRNSRARRPRRLHASRQARRSRNP